MPAEPPNPPPPVIEMKDVTVPALRDPRLAVAVNVDWIVRPGDYWVIGGLQGSGKTDFLMMTAGLIGAQSGVYNLFGLEMPIFEGADLKERLRVGFVFETGQLFNHLTIEENVSLPLRYHRNLSAEAAHDETRQLLEVLELGSIADSTPGSLGRNWQKRAGLARALMLRPELLLLDNPLAGLDLRHSNWWLNLLDALAEGHSWLHGRPVTLVVTASDLRSWKGRGRNFAVLHDKHLKRLGTWSELTIMSGQMVNDLLDAETREI